MSDISMLKDFTGQYSKVKTIQKGTRDNKEINVLQTDTGIIVLDSTGHLSKDHYQTVKDYWKKEPDIIDRQDTLRRAELLINYKRKAWLDIGAGRGLLQDAIGASDCIEPQPEARDALKGKGCHVFSDLSEVSKKYDLITMFHVLEHIPNQKEYIDKVYSKLKSGGVLIIEVPHARNRLIDDCKAFREFTFWSEHFILHTDKSLLHILKDFDTQIIYEQRYSLANYKYWMQKGKPGGHIHLTCDENSEKRFTESLIKNRISDTLIAIATKP